MIQSIYYVLKVEFYEYDLTLRLDMTSFLYR